MHSPKIHCISEVFSYTTVRVLDIMKLCRMITTIIKKKYQQQQRQQNKTKNVISASGMVAEKKYKRCHDKMVSISDSATNQRIWSKPTKSRSYRISTSERIEYFRSPNQISSSLKDNPVMAFSSILLFLLTIASRTKELKSSKCSSTTDSNLPECSAFQLLLEHFNLYYRKLKIYV